MFFCWVLLHIIWPSLQKLTQLSQLCLCKIHTFSHFDKCHTTQQGDRKVCVKTRYSTYTTLWSTTMLGIAPSPALGNVRLMSICQTPTPCTLQAWACTWVGRGGSCANVTTPTTCSNCTDVIRVVTNANIDSGGLGPAAPSELENNKHDMHSVSRLTKRLNIFPKTEQDYTVRTSGGAAYRGRVRNNHDTDACGVDHVWRALNCNSLEHIVVDPRYDVRLLFDIYICRERKWLAGGGTWYCRSHMMKQLCCVFWKCSVSIKYICCLPTEACGLNPLSPWLIIVCAGVFFNIILTFAVLFFFVSIAFCTCQEYIA